jgi:hypothetical protein
LWIKFCVHLSSPMRATCLPNLITKCETLHRAMFSGASYWFFRRAAVPHPVLKLVQTLRNTRTTTLGMYRRDVWTHMNSW